MHLLQGDEDADDEEGDGDEEDEDENEEDGFLPTGTSEKTSLSSADFNLINKVVLGNETIGQCYSDVTCYKCTHGYQAIVNFCLLERTKRRGLAIVRKQPLTELMLVLTRQKRRTRY